MTREETEALLPFLANNTLAKEEREAVEAAVAADASLQEELAALRVIRDTMQAEDIQSPADFGLARLMRATEAPPKTVKPILWQVAAGVLLAVVLGQGALMMRDPASDGYELAGQSDAALIGFTPTTTEAAMRDLLLDAGVEIIGGPSALGLYQYAPIEGVTFAQANAILKASDLVDTLEAPLEER